MRSHLNAHHLCGHPSVCPPIRMIVKGWKEMICFELWAREPGCVHETWIFQNSWSNGPLQRKIMRFSIDRYKGFTGWLLARRICLEFYHSSRKKGWVFLKPLVPENAGRKLSLWTDEFAFSGSHFHQWGFTLCYMRLCYHILSHEAMPIPCLTVMNFAKS